MEMAVFEDLSEIENKIFYLGPLLYVRLSSAVFVCSCINPFALRKAKIVYSFGLSSCSRVTLSFCM